MPPSDSLNASFQFNATFPPGTPWCGNLDATGGMRGRQISGLDWTMNTAATPLQAHLSASLTAENLTVSLRELIANPGTDLTASLKDLVASFDRGSFERAASRSGEDVRVWLREGYDTRQATADSAPATATPPGAAQQQQHCGGAAQLRAAAGSSHDATPATLPLPGGTPPLLPAQAAQLPPSLLPDFPTGANDPAPRPMTPSVDQVQLPGWATPAQASAAEGAADSVAWPSVPSQPVIAPLLP